MLIHPASSMDPASIQHPAIEAKIFNLFRHNPDDALPNGVIKALSHSPALISPSLLAPAQLGSSAVLCLKLQALHWFNRLPHLRLLEVSDQHRCCSNCTAVAAPLCMPLNVLQPNTHAPALY